MSCSHSEVEYNFLQRPYCKLEELIIQLKCVCLSSFHCKAMIEEMMYKTYAASLLNPEHKEMIVITGLKQWIISFS